MHTHEGGPLKGRYEDPLEYAEEMKQPRHHKRVNRQQNSNDNQHRELVAYATCLTSQGEISPPCSGF
jgi:hypothetical protein